MSSDTPDEDAGAVGGVNDDPQSDSSTSDYDSMYSIKDVDGGGFKKAKRKILKIFKRLNTDTADSNTPGRKSQKPPDHSDVYDFTYPKTGLCLIINNDTFVQMPDRPGSANDVTSVRRAFTNRGFTVKEYNNLSASDMDKKLRKAAQKFDHTNSCCFVCIILSHGDEYVNERRERKDLVFGSDDQPIYVSYIMRIFDDSNCPGLLDKPRLFFIQACRGKKKERGVDITLVQKRNVTAYRRSFKWRGNESVDHGMEAGEDGSLVSAETEPLTSDGNLGNTGASGDISSSVDPPLEDQPSTNEAATGPVDNLASKLELMEITEEEETDFINYWKNYKKKPLLTPSPCYKDSLVMYSSPPGYFSFRRDSGSWFLQSLALILREAGSDKSLFHILTRVSRRMAMDYITKNKNKPEIDGCKIVPCMISMLTKEIFLRPREEL